MTQQEFEQRTGFITTHEMYAEIETQYMESELDKDKFCKVWVKHGGIEEMSTRMAAQIRNLRRDFDNERLKRDKEREHANNELLEVIEMRNAYADELIRIFNLEDDHNAMYAFFKKLVSEYKNKK